jgi:hypothetical protein
MGTLLSYQEGIIPMLLVEFKSKKEQLSQRARKFSRLQLYTQNLPDSSDTENQSGTLLGQTIGTPAIVGFFESHISGLL